MDPQPPASIQRGFGPQVGASFGSYNPAQPATQNMSFADRIFGPHMLPIAGALMSGRPEALGRGFTAAGLIQQDEADRRREAQQRQAAINATAQYLEKDNPEAAEAIRAGAPVGPIMAEMARGRTKPSAFQEQINAFRRANPDATEAEALEWYKNQGQPDVQVGGLGKGEILRKDDKGGYFIDTIPGSEAARKAEEAARSQAEQTGARQVSGDIVVTAASRARDAASKQDVGRSATTIAGVAPWTESAEVVRQTSVLRNLASAEALNAMRRQSPTGGALGNVTERELDLLAKQSGTLDPNSPNFLRDLEDYERNLLMTIHGPDAGARIFNETRSGYAPPADDVPEGVNPEDWRYMTDEEKALFR